MKRCIAFSAHRQMYRTTCVWQCTRLHLGCLGSVLQGTSPRLALTLAAFAWWVGTPAPCHTADCTALCAIHFWLAPRVLTWLLMMRLGQCSPESHAVSPCVSVLHCDMHADVAMVYCNMMRPVMCVPTAHHAACALSPMCLASPLPGLSNTCRGYTLASLMPSTCCHVAISTGVCTSCRRAGPCD